MLASYVFNGSSRRLPRAQALWVPTIFSAFGPVWLTPCSPLTSSMLVRYGCLALRRDGCRLCLCLVQFGSHLARLSRFQWFFETAASRSGAVGADAIRCLVQLGSHLARLSRFQLFYETAASRSGAMNADSTQCLVQLGSHLARLSRFLMVLRDGCLTLWRDGCR